jgi:hypothetical protein
LAIKTMRVSPAIVWKIPSLTLIPTFTIVAILTDIQLAVTS